MVADHHRVGRVDGRPASPERKTKPHAASLRIDRDDVQPGHEQHVPQAVDRGGHGRGVAGGFVSRLPNRRPVGQRQRDQPGTAAAADVQQQFVTFDNRAAAGPKVPIRARNSLYTWRNQRLLAALEVNGSQLAARAEQVDALLVDQRHHARAVVFGDRTRVFGWKGRLPLRLARGGIETFSDELISLSMEEYGAAADDCQAGKAAADVALPGGARSATGPHGQLLALSDAVAVRTEDLRPIAGPAPPAAAITTARVTRVCSPRRGRRWFGRI